MPAAVLAPPSIHATIRYMGIPDHDESALYDQGGRPLGPRAQTTRVRILDATVGMGGHAFALLSEHKDATHLAFDRDERALELASTRLAPFAQRVEFRHGDFRDGLSDLAPQSLCYAIADLGVSSLQLDDKDRGFSFRFDAPLDMRMDPRGGRSASDLLNTASERELERIFTELRDVQLKDAVWPKFLRENAKRVFKLDDVYELPA